MEELINNPPLQIHNCYDRNSDQRDRLHGWGSFSSLLVWTFALFWIPAPLPADDSPYFDESEEAQALFLRQRVANQTLLRDPESKILIDRMKSSLQEGNHLEAAQLFQAILETPHDSFQWESDYKLKSTWSSAVDLYSSYPEAVTVYIELYDSQANECWKSASVTSSADVVKRFYPTPTARKALLSLAQHQWDRGQFEKCAQTFALLTLSPIHSKHLSEKTWNQIGYVSELTSNTQLADAIQNEVINERDQEQITQLRSFLQSRQSLSTLSVNLFDSYSSYPHSKSHRSVPMPSAIWSIARSPWFSENSEPSESQQSIRTALEQWSSQKKDQLDSELSCLSAVCLNDCIYFRDLNHVVACRLDIENASSAQPVWRWESKSPLLEVLDSQIDPYTGVNTNHPGLERLHLGNSVTNSLTTDGNHLFLVDRVMRTTDPLFEQTVSVESASDDISTQPASIRDCEVLINRLVALDVAQKDQSTPSIAWTIDDRGLSQAAESTETQSHPLSGHYFFGPPTHHGGACYVASEKSGFLFVSALNPENGHAIWSHPISLVDRPLARDIIRANHAIRCIAAGDRILCDNGNGQIVAIDSTLGTLSWAYCYADPDSRQESGRWTYSQTTRRCEAGAISDPLICNGTVVLLPQRSAYIHCASLETGELLWSVPREDAQYLTMASLPGSDPSQENELLLISVASQACSALNPKNGQQIWKTQTGLVSGRGIALGPRYLIPIAEDNSELSGENSKEGLPATRVCAGRIQSLDLKTGRLEASNLYANFGVDATESGFDHPGGSSPFAPGNLMAWNDHILAIGIDQILAYRQAGSVIDELSLAADSTKLTESQSQQYAIAKVLIGDVEEALDDLQITLSLPSTSIPVRKQTTQLYRELLYAEIAKYRNNDLKSPPHHLLTELKSLIDSDHERARFLITEIEQLAFEKDAEKLWEATERFAQLGTPIAIPNRGQAGHLATSASWFPGVYGRLLHDMPTQRRQELLKHFQEEQLGKLASLSDSELETYLELFSHQAPLLQRVNGECTPEEESEFPAEQHELTILRDRIGCELATRAMNQGKYLEAELRLLQAKRSCLSETRHFALKLLTALYGQVDRHELAAAAIAELSESMEQVRETPFHWTPGPITPISTKPFSLVDRLRAVPHADQWDEERFADDTAFLIHFDQNHPAWRSFQLRVDAKIPVRTARFVEQPVNLASLTPALRPRSVVTSNSDQGWLITHRTEELTPPSANKGTVLAQLGVTQEEKSEEHQVLQLRDQTTGQIQTEIVLPGERISLPVGSNRQVGHMLPVIADGRLMGISVLDGRPMWERSAANNRRILARTKNLWQLDDRNRVEFNSNDQKSHATRSARVELGPVGHGFCITQTARAVTCLDPLSGKLLWSRTDLPPHGGLWSDRQTGFIGDEQVLVYFHSDRVSYTLLATRTGQVISTGRLVNPEIHVQRTREAFGRRLLFVTVSPDSSRARTLQLWDPLSEECPFEMALTPRDLYEVADGAITVLLERNRLVVFDLETNQFLADLPIDLEDYSPNYLRVARIGKRYLVNTYQTERIVESTGYASRFTETPCQVTHINGLTFSIHTETRQLEWTRLFPHRSILSRPDQHIPFLVLCATHQTKPGDPNRSLLVEVIDPATGKTLNRRDDFDMKQVAAVCHDPSEQVVTLVGAEREVAIEYSRTHSTAQRLSQTALAEANELP